MKEYAFENDSIDVTQLKADMMDKESYTRAHQGLVILCHDVFIRYKQGIVLVKRLNEPAKNLLWPIGGRIKRGTNIEDSLREKVWNEAHLELGTTTELGIARTFFSTEPFGHGKGTDTVNVVYVGEGRGSLRLDNLHTDPVIVLPDEYQTKYRNILHPYVKDFMDRAIQLV